MVDGDGDHGQGEHWDCLLTGFYWHSNRLFSTPTHGNGYQVGVFQQADLLEEETHPQTLCLRMLTGLSTGGLGKKKGAMYFPAGI
jgi:hypothetical protein